MIRLLADENFNGRILRGVRREMPDADVVRAQDTEMYQAADPDLLEWAAQQGRIVLTHDIETLVGFAHARVASGKPMPGVFAVPYDAPIGRVIEDLLTIVGASNTAEWNSLVTFLPF
jgi:hypothetical protein